MKIPRQSYMLEFKELAVKRINEGQSIATVARELGVIEQTLRNWVASATRGALSGSTAKNVSAEQMELSKLRAELVRLKRENEIIKKAAAYFAKDVV